MKKFATILLALLFVPSVSSAAALTQQQSNSLIAVVQSSPGTPASAFVSLITAFSNITVNQATSLITVVQSAPSAPASAFVSLLTSFTVDTPTTQPVTSAVAPSMSPQPTQTNQQTTQPVTPTQTTAPMTPSVSIAMPTITLSANPTSITSGQSVTISYQVTNATSCTATGGWSGTYNAPAGFVNAWTGDKGPFYPTQTTTYTFNCAGAGGSATQSVTVSTVPSSWTINVSTSNGTTAQANVGKISFQVSVQKDGNYVKQPITVTTNDPDLPSSFVINAPFATQLATNGDVSANQFFCVAPLPPQYKISNGCPVENPVAVGTFDVTFTVENVSKTVPITVLAPPTPQQVVVPTLTAYALPSSGNQTVVAGTKNVVLGVFNLSATADNLNVSKVAFDIKGYQNVQNLVLRQGTSQNGVQLGMMIPTLTASANSFSVNLQIPKNDGAGGLTLYGDVVPNATGTIQPVLVSGSSGTSSTRASDGVTVFLNADTTLQITTIQ